MQILLLYIISIMSIVIYGGKMEIVFYSPSFDKSGWIPTNFTCDGSDISPKLVWSHLPAETKSIAIINDDPDAPMGTWVHWLIYNIPSTISQLDEGQPRKEILPNNALQGRNSWGKIGYGGPCPPSGTHRYFFRLYALDQKLSIMPGASKEELLKAMEGHILGQAEFYGKYSRKK